MRKPRKRQAAGLKARPLDPSNNQSAAQPTTQSLADERFLIHQMMAAQLGLEWRRIAFMAIVASKSGTGSIRRPYLSLHGAVRAVERARERGVDARIQLVELRPIGGDL